MRIVIITGTSGSGKSTAIHALEDIGYYTIDNLPIALLEKLVELVGGGAGEVHKLALVIDARELRVSARKGRDGDLLHVPSAIDRLRRAGHEVDLAFLDATDDTLMRRFSETRRRHPHGGSKDLHTGIATERRLLEPLKNAATLCIDTDELSVHDLKRRIQELFSTGATAMPRLAVTILSFGYKHGVPTNADLLFDVRFLPNPHFVDKLRSRTGLDAEVAAYVLASPDASTFLAKIADLLEFLIPQYEHEGKAYATIAFGCTGGRHRSVAVAERVAEIFRAHGRRVDVRHRDVSK